MHSCWKKSDGEWMCTKPCLAWRTLRHACQFLWADRLFQSGQLVTHEIISNTATCLARVSPWGSQASLWVFGNADILSTAWPKLAQSCWDSGLVWRWEAQAAWLKAASTPRNQVFEHWLRPLSKLWWCSYTTSGRLRDMPFSLVGLVLHFKNMASLPHPKQIDLSKGMQVCSVVAHLYRGSWDFMSVTKYRSWPFVG